MRTGKRVWLVRMTQRALFETAAGTVAGTLDGGKSVRVRLADPGEGTKVVDRPAAEVFESEKIALLHAAKMCQDSANRYFGQAVKLYEAAARRAK
jgi:hypothetical protein